MCNNVAVKIPEQSHVVCDCFIRNLRFACFHPMTCCRDGEVISEFWREEYTTMPLACISYVESVVYLTKEDEWLLDSLTGT